MHYVVEYEIASLLFELFILVYASVFYPVTSKKNLLFRIIAVNMIVTTFCDVATAIMINNSIFISEKVNLWANTFYFLGGTFLAYLYTVYIDLYIIPEEGKHLFRKTRLVAIILLELNIILNAKTKWLFYFDEQKQYTHGKFYLLVYAGTLFFIIMVVVSIFANIKIMPRAQRVFGYLLILLFILPTIVQMLWMSDTLLMMFGAALLLLLNFFWLETPDYVRLNETLIELNEAQHKLEENNIQLQKEKNRADNASQAKTQFLANMSHEIRTPINAVLGMNTMILRESKDKNIRGYASDIQNAGRTLLSLINDILDFTKIESGKMELVPANYDFSTVIGDIINMVKPKADDKGLSFDIDVDESIPCTMLGDDIRIRQILVNLMTNAVKYTPSGKVTMSVELLDCADEACLKFSVKDTGIGIKDEDISKLTKEFVRIEESRNRNIEGTGLGINIVVSLLNMMGSKLEVESVYGEGSTFYFILNQTVVDKTAVGDIKKKIRSNVEVEEYKVAFVAPDARLLVVDDNAMNRKVFRSLLRNIRCTIDEVESGFLCLDYVKNQKYDIIFMDHMMPEMDGIETYDHMKEMGEYVNANTPVVILTANAINGAREEYLAEGFTDYLSKPINPNKLEEMIGELLPDDKKQIEDNSENSNTNEPEEIDLPYIDGVDWKHALSNLKDEGLLREMVTGFSKAAESDIELLIEMYDRLKISEMPKSDDFASFRIKVHSMKSNVATIGANHLAGLAKYIEHAARDEDCATIENLMPLFETEWRKLKSEVDEAFGLNISNGDSSVSKDAIGNDSLAIFLDALRESMNEADFDRADAVVDELSEYSYTDKQMEYFEEIKMHVLNIDTSKCLDVIDKWEKLLQ